LDNSSYSSFSLSGDNDLTNAEVDNWWSCNTTPTRAVRWWVAGSQKERQKEAC
jgi:hypothetical protein